MMVSAVMVIHSYNFCIRVILIALQMWMNVLKTLMAVVRHVAILMGPSCVLVAQGSLWQMTIWVVMVQKKLTSCRQLNCHVYIIVTKLAQII